MFWSRGVLGIAGTTTSIDVTGRYWWNGLGNC